MERKRLQISMAGTYSVYVAVFFYQYGVQICSYGTSAKVSKKFSILFDKLTMNVTILLRFARQ